MPDTPVATPSLSSIALVRFSALGDVALVVPAVRSLQNCFPHTTLTWITSPLGYSLLEGLEGVRFEVFDKPRTLADYLNFYRAFHNRSFDVVLAMQASLRINLLYPALRAPVKIGFDRIRAREGQWLFCNRSIPFADTHLADSFLAFAAQLGATPQPAVWDLPVTETDRAWALEQVRHLPRPLIAIHPCSSKAERNWPPQRYAEVIRAAQQRWQCGFVFTGSDNPPQREVCAQLTAAAGQGSVNLCGRTTLKQLAALLGAADGLIAPDTAAVHLARAMNTPAIGLYAVISPNLSGPYQRQEFVVNRYPDAVRKFLGKNPDHLPWNTRVHHPDAMSLITADDVLRQLERLLQR
jgi:heptosyltransferase I